MLVTQTSAGFIIKPSDLVEKERYFYKAAVFYGKNETFLNQELIDHGLATPYQS